MTIGLGGLGTAPLGGNVEGGQKPVAPSLDPRYLVTFDPQIRVVELEVGHAMKSFSDKDTPDVDTLGFDFAKRLGTGETISTVVMGVEQDSYRYEQDDAPLALLQGDAAVSGTKVLQVIKGGVHGVVYEFVVTITTSLARTLTGRARLRVWAE